MNARNTNTSGLGLVRQPKAIFFGPDVRFALPGVVSALGDRALICTDARMAGTPEFADIASRLREGGIDVSVFGDVLPDLPRSDIEALVARFGGERFDVVIGLGGGSCLDMAKIAAVMLTHGGEVSTYYGEFKVPGPTIPIVTIPTTGGTGAEATCISVIHDPDLGVKVGVASPYLEPHTAVVDPVLTLSAPPGLTAATGADALSHLIEAFTAISKNPAPAATSAHVYVGKNRLTDVYCRVGLELIAQGLTRAYTTPNDLEARADTMLAALNAGLAINSTGTAAAHALQTPIGSLTSTPHGVGVGVLLPYVMRYNLPERVPEFAEVGRLMGATVSDGDELSQARAGILRVEEVLSSIGIPHTLADLGVQREWIGHIADQSMLATRLIPNNPRTLDRAGAELILVKAFEGDRTWW